MWSFHHMKKILTAHQNLDPTLDRDKIVLKNEQNELVKYNPTTKIPLDKKFQHGRMYIWGNFIPFCLKLYILNNLNIENTGIYDKNGEIGPFGKLNGELRCNLRVFPLKIPQNRAKITVLAYF